VHSSMMYASVTRRN